MSRDFPNGGERLGGSRKFEDIERRKSEAAWERSLRSHYAIQLGTMVADGLEEFGIVARGNFKLSYFESMVDIEL